MTLYINNILAKNMIFNGYLKFDDIHEDDIIFSIKYDNLEPVLIPSILANNMRFNRSLKFEELCWDDEIERIDYH